jgi:hypothetical protein
MVLFLEGLRDFYLLQNVQTSSGTYLTSKSVGARCSFPEHEPYNFHLALGLRMTGSMSLTPTFHGMYGEKLYLHFEQFSVI